MLRPIPRLASLTPVPTHAALLNVYALPKLADPQELAGGTVVVIDVLRASTVTVFALEAGAREVIPCLEVEEARPVPGGCRRASACWAASGGGCRSRGSTWATRRRNIRPERVAGRTVVLSTTNGVRAMLHARRAENVLIGAFVNATAVLRRLLGQERVHLLCAGTDGEISEDDILLAGMLVERLQRLGGMTYVPNAQAMAAGEFWLHSFALPQALGAEPLPPEVLAEQLANSPGGRNLIDIGMGDDLLVAAEIDRFQCVPRLDRRDGHIRRS